LCVRTLDTFHMQVPGHPLYVPGSGSLNPLYCVAWAVPLSYLVLWIGHCGPLVFSRIPQRIGDLSYGVYIWHMVVINTVLFFHLPDRMNWLPAGVQMLVFASTFAAAALSWQLIERPALRLKPYSSHVTTRTISPPGSSHTTAMPLGVAHSRIR